MNLHQTQLEWIEPGAVSARAARMPVGKRLLHRIFVISVAVLFTLTFAGGSAIPAQEASIRQIAYAVKGYNFELLSWQFDAIGAKLSAWVRQPANEISPQEAAQLVRAHLGRAQKIYELQGQLERIIGEQKSAPAPNVALLQAEIDRLRREQEEERGTVEQIIEHQVSSVLAAEGIGVAGYALPPVLFTFTEPPKKLVVSPRTRIEQLYGQMLDPEMPLAAIEQSEKAIGAEQALSAYITNIGGLGAYPTMVIDSASLPWVLSTVAHEWVHNYLTFFPLGFNYAHTSDLIIINETVAEVVGNEIGEKTLRQFYPDLAPPPRQSGAPPVPLDGPAGFDFGAEMRVTRLVVDRLLARGQVDKAEAYMEERRRLFVAHGYPLRVLNQAYFAFHGAYGTSAASSSPLGPQLERLRTSVPDVKTYLQVVRSFLTPEDVEQALHQWETGQAK
jgi:hypothetical protein